MAVKNFWRGTRLWIFWDVGWILHYVRDPNLMELVRGTGVPCPEASYWLIYD
jgi:hypothetical protein